MPKEERLTRKNFYLPFYETVKAKDEKFGTKFIPKGLNKNSKLEDLKKFQELMETRFSLMDLTVSNSKQRNFLKEFHQFYEARDEKKRLNEIKKEEHSSRFVNVLNDVVSRNFKNSKEYQRKDDFSEIKKSKHISRRFTNVLTDILLKRNVEFIKEYRVRIKISLTNEWKNKDGSLSNRINDDVVYEIETVKARTLDELHHKLEKYYNESIWTWEDSEQVHTCNDITFEILDREKLLKMAKTQKTQLMKSGSIILQKEWLRYGKNVSQTAFEETDDECCYYQLSQFINNPPSGRPQIYIKYRASKYKTNREGLFQFFCEIADKEVYPNFNIKSGVSTEMIMKLCETLGRSCYAYDGNDRCFEKYVMNNKKYCPIAFYKYNGHMFLISDKSCFKSIAESNNSNVKITTSLVETSIEENVDTQLEVEYITNFDVSNAKNMESKLYIINKNSLFDEFKNYIVINNSQPDVKTKEGKIVYICYKNKNEERVVVTCDNNHGKFNHNDDEELYMLIKEQCQKNNIKYTNQGFGTIVNQLLDRFDGKEKRIYLSKEQKHEVRQKTNGLCAICNLKAKKYEYDHIQPLSNGGNNDVDNFQILCVDCHLKKTTEEQQDGTQKIISKVHSSFNNIVFEKVIDTIYFKTHQFVEKIQREIEDLPIFKIDTKRCRKNIVCCSKFEFPVYSVMDHPKKFIGNIQCGFYYVVSENSFPLRGCGWYCQALVEYCLENQIIKLDDIWYEFIPSNKLPSNYFKERINYLIECFDVPMFQKMGPNVLVGLWGIQKKKSTYSKFSIVEDEASQWFVENNNTFITSHKLTNEKELFEAIYENEMIVDDNAYPLYSMVLQIEALELHKLEQIIINKGGIPLDRNTDAIRYQRKKEINIDTYFWDDEKTIPKYQIEQNKPLKHEAKPHFIRNNKFKKFGEFDCEWNIQYDMEAQEIFNMKESMLINGRAGVGKTYLVNQIIELIKENKKKFDCLAPTNKSARLINGMTLDRINHKNITNNKMLVKWAQNLNYLVVDEISMVKEKFYRLLTNIKKINPKIIFYICGDFKQLKPVNDSWKGDYENSAALKDLCDNNKMLLTKCKRADEWLFNLCQNIQLVNVNDFEEKNSTFLNVCYFHETRIEVNNICMERFLMKHNSNYIEIPEDEDNPKTQLVKLAVGMPIICHRTNKKLNILNSDRFIISSINNDIITYTNEVRTENNEEDLTIETHLFHKYFYIAFCITSHASQGETFKEPYTIYDWKLMNDTAKYVCLSRGTNRENIQIHVGKIKSK